MYFMVHRRLLRIQRMRFLFHFIVFAFYFEEEKKYSICKNEQMIIKKAAKKNQNEFHKSITFTACNNVHSASMLKCVQVMMAFDREKKTVYQNDECAHNF